MRHHWSHDHLICTMWFPIGDPLIPTCYLELFPRSTLVHKWRKIIQELWPTQRAAITLSSFKLSCILQLVQFKAYLVFIMWFTCAGICVHALWLVILLSAVYQAACCDTVSWWWSGNVWWWQSTLWWWTASWQCMHNVLWCFSKFGSWKTQLDKAYSTAADKVFELFFFIFYKLLTDRNNTSMQQKPRPSELSTFLRPQSGLE